MGEFWDNLYEHELELTNNLREFLGPSVESQLHFVSKHLGPNSLIAYAIPLFGSYDVYLMSKLMIVIASLNLICGVLKILLPEDRPYWYAVKKEKEIKQSKITCETTAGFPSGHSIIFAAFWYTIVSYYYPDMSPLSVILWISPLMSLIIISRMYFYCHFFHQCAVGSIMGLVFSIWYNQEHVEDFVLNMTPIESITVYLTVSLIAILIYFAVLKFGTDPDWCIQEAMSTCEDSEWIHMDSSPVYNIAKDLGALAGLALSAPLLEKVEGSMEKSKSVPMAILFAALNIFIGSKIPSSSEKGAFYSFGFIRNMVFYYSLINLIPRFSMLEKPCPCMHNH